MPANSLTVPSLPPTCNSLEASQRARLLKSARKLGDVLGATPHVLDMDLVHSGTSGVQEKRSALFLSSSAASSVTSFNAESTGSYDSSPYPPLYRHSSHIPLIEFAPKKQSYGQFKPSKRATPLLLHLRSRPSLPDLGAKSRQEGNTVLRSTITIPNSPLFLPTDQDQDLAAFDDSDKIRRKRMAKLTRTLGEAVPPELVFSQSHQRSPSEPSPPSQWYDECKPVNDRRLQSLADNTYPSPPPPLSTSLSFTLKDRRRSTNAGSLCIFEATMVTEPSHAAPLLLQADPLPPVPVMPQYAGDPGWNGEWSIKDAEKRAMALRNLRSR